MKEQKSMNSFESKARVADDAARQARQRYRESRREASRERRQARHSARAARRSACRRIGGVLESERQGYRRARQEMETVLRSQWLVLWWMCFGDEEVRENIQVIKEEIRSTYEYYKETRRRIRGQWRRNRKITGYVKRIGNRYVRDVVRTE